MKVFTIKDKKANYYYPPQLYRNVDEAVRACKNSVDKNDGSLFCKNSEDFSLFRIGEWDEVTGTYTVLDKTHICDLMDLVTKE